MKKYILILLTSFAFGQKPFSKENPNNVLAVKACAYVNLLDGGYGSIFGLEKGFLKNHSFGIKYINNRFTPHREDTENDYKPIDYTSDKDISFIMEYKYYFDFKYMKESNWSPYISLSYKTGKRTIDNDIDYEHDFYHRITNYDLIGTTFGTIFILNESETWTLDMQIGYLFGRKKQFTEGRLPENSTFKTDLFRFEIMIVYNIY